VGRRRVRDGAARAGACAGLRLGSAARLPASACAGRQSDDAVEGGRRPPSVLRHAPVRQRHAVVRELPRSGARVYRRQGPRRGIDRRSASARRDEPRQHRVRVRADLGEPGADAARGSGARADVRRPSDRARPREAGRGDAGSPAEGRRLSEADAGRVSRRRGSVHGRQRHARDRVVRADDHLGAFALRPV
jgi:hypothetical protein